MRSTVACSARRSETNETVPEPRVVRAPSHLTQADDVSVPRSFGVPSVIERIHPPIAASVWVLSAALVDSRIVLLGQRFLGVGPDSGFRRLLVRADVLLRVRIAAHGFLRARLVRTRCVLPNRLFGIGVITITTMVLTRCVRPYMRFMAYIGSLDRFVRPPPGLRCGFVGTVLSLMVRRHPMSPSRRSGTRIVCTTSVTDTTRRIRVQFVGMFQPAVVLDPFGFHSFFAFRSLRIQLLGLCRLTISFSSTSIGFGFCALCLCSLLFDFGFSSTNIMFGFGSLLPNLRGLLPLVFALLRCRLAADCDDDADDDQDHDDGDDDPDDG